MSEARENRALQEDEIDLFELVKTIWAGRRFIAKAVGSFVVLGLIIAFTSSVEYKATCKLLPESQEEQISNLGSFGGLAGLAGLDLGGLSSNSGELSPQLYPEIVNSLPFILEVINDTIYFEQKNIKTSPFYYFKEVHRLSLIEYALKYTIGLPHLIKDKKEITNIDSPFLKISKEDWKLIEKFKKRISIFVDDETGILELQIEMPDPYAAAQIAKKIELLITKTVVEYKTEKAKKNLEFIQQTCLEAKEEFEAIQLNLARATDRNLNVNSATAEIQLRNIENEYDISFEVYKGLASQVEQAKIQLKEETPVFTILEPVRIPEDKSSPKRLLILLGMAFFGLVTAATKIVVVHVSDKIFRIN